MKAFAFLASTLLSVSLLAAWPEDFQQLRNKSRSYSDAGAICEELARLKFEKQYDVSSYEIEVGIAYGDHKRTIGELDVVIFDRASRKVVRVAEVKCWKDLKGGLRKARDQRQRFLSNMKADKPIHYQSTSTEQIFRQDQFEGVTSFTTFGQKGSVNAGYDDELDYDLSELHRMSAQMRECQARGECARPPH